MVALSIRFDGIEPAAHPSRIDPGNRLVAERWLDAVIEAIGISHNSRCALTAGASQFRMPRVDIGLPEFGNGQAFRSLHLPDGLARVFASPCCCQSSDGQIAGARRMRRAFKGNSADWPEIDAEF